MIPALGYAAHDNSSPMAPWRFERRDPGPTDVRIRIEYCGVCHSDLHFVRGEWGPIKYPQAQPATLVMRSVISQVRSKKGCSSSMATPRPITDEAKKISCRRCFARSNNRRAIEPNEKK